LSNNYQKTRFLFKKPAQNGVGILYSFLKIGRYRRGLRQKIVEEASNLFEVNQIVRAARLFTIKFFDTQSVLI